MAAIIALTPPLIPLICFMDLANFMFLSRSCTHKEEEGQPHSSNTSRKSFARLFFPSCIIPNNISHKNSVQATDFLQCKQCLCNVTVFENWCDEIMSPFQIIGKWLYFFLGDIRVVVAWLFVICCA